MQRDARIALQVTVAGIVISTVLAVGAWLWPDPLHGSTASAGATPAVTRAAGQSASPGNVSTRKPASKPSGTPSSSTTTLISLKPNTCFNYTDISDFDFNKDLNDGPSNSPVTVVPCTTSHQAEAIQVDKAYEFVPGDYVDGCEKMAPVEVNIDTSRSYAESANGSAHGPGVCIVSYFSPTTKTWSPGQ